MISALNGFDTNAAQAPFPHRSRIANDSSAVVTKTGTLHGEVGLAARGRTSRQMHVRDHTLRRTVQPGGEKCSGTVEQCGVEAARPQ
jgi:hypothetical protein